jgi:hypothetical protein
MDAGLEGAFLAEGVQVGECAELRELIVDLSGHMLVAGFGDFLQGLNIQRESYLN